MGYEVVREHGGVGVRGSLLDCLEYSWVEWGCQGFVWGTQHEATKWGKGHEGTGGKLDVWRVEVQWNLMGEGAGESDNGWFLGSF